MTQSNNNSYYLNRDYNDDYSSVESIFPDYRYIWHNMYYKGMLSDIRNYDNKEYFDSHLTRTLYLKDGKYDINIKAYAIIGSFIEIAYDLYFEKNNNNKIINYFKEKSRFVVDGLNDGYNKLILLSTCVLLLQVKNCFISLY